MKKNLLLLFMLCGILQKVSAQWVTQTSTATANLNSVYFLNANTGFAVGGNELLKTTDGGATWLKDPIGTYYNLNDIFFTSATVGYMCGSDYNNGSSRVLKTTDAGVTWTSKQLSTSYSLQKINFADVNTGFTSDVHGCIYKTTDGGTTWSTTAVGGCNGLGSLSSMFFTTPSIGFITCADIYGGIQKTINGGATWTTKPHMGTMDFSDIFFVNTNEGWAVGFNGTIMHTTDAGETWATQTSGTTQNLTAVHFINSLTGFAVGNNGTILKTIDGGNNWMIQQSNTFEVLKSVHFVNTQVGWTVGMSATILKTSNAGEAPSDVLDQEYSNKNLLVSLNPITNIIKIKDINNHKYVIDIVNSFGQKMISLNGNIEQININLPCISSWVHGVYLVQIKDLITQEIKTEKIIKH